MPLPRRGPILHQDPSTSSLTSTTSWPLSTVSDFYRTTLPDLVPVRKSLASGRSEVGPRRNRAGERALAISVETGYTFKGPLSGRSRGADSCLAGNPLASLQPVSLRVLAVVLASLAVEAFGGGVASFPALISIPWVICAHGA